MEQDAARGEEQTVAGEQLWASDFVHLRDGKWWRCKQSESVQAALMHDTTEGERMDPIVGKMTLGETDELPTPTYIESQP